MQPQSPKRDFAWDFEGKVYNMESNGRVRIIALVGAVVLAAAIGVVGIRPSYGRSDSGGIARSGFSFTSAPDLIYPVTDHIVLSGKEYLDFKWRETNLVQTRYFDFRLYKGYNTLAADLIFKKEVPVGEYPFRLPASMFEEGQVYTWTLVQVFLGGEKSDKSYSPFKVIKK